MQQQPTKGVGCVRGSRCASMGCSPLPPSSSGVSSSSSINNGGNDSDDRANDAHLVGSGTQPWGKSLAAKLFRLFLWFPLMMRHLLCILFNPFGASRAPSRDKDYAKSKKDDDYSGRWGNEPLPGERQVASSVTRQTDPSCLSVPDADLETLSDHHTCSGMASVDSVRRRVLANELINQRLERENPESMRTKFRINACTWNVDQQPPPDSRDALHEWLLGRNLMQLLKTHRALEQKCKESATNSRPPFPIEEFPDMVIVSLQEVEMGGVVLVREHTETSVSWAESIVESLNSASERNVWYRKLKMVQLVGLVLIIVARVEHTRYVANIHASLARTGAMRGVWGNKGSVGVRATIYGKRFLLIAAHFVAHKNNERTRTFNYHASLGDLCFEIPENADDEVDVLQTFGVGSNESDMPHGKIERRPRWRRFFRKFVRSSCGLLEQRMLDQHDYVFFLGDLNSRLHGVKSAEIRQLVWRAEYDKLICHDELRQGMISGDTFDGFQEALITFPPTYKFDRGTDVYDTSRKKRDPAWCDRILFRVKLPSDSSAVDTDAERNLDGSHNFYNSHCPVSSNSSRKTAEMSPARPHTMPDYPYYRERVCDPFLVSNDEEGVCQNVCLSSPESNSDLSLSIRSDHPVSDTKINDSNHLEAESVDGSRTPIEPRPLPTFLSARQSVCMEERPMAFQMVPNKVIVLDYHHVPFMRHSDHRPVCAQFEVSVLSLQKELVDDVMQGVRERIGQEEQVYFDELY